MTIHLLDSDAVIDQISGRTATVDLLNELIAAGHDLAVAGVVVGEVFSGAAPTERPALTAWFSRLTYLPTNYEAAQLAGEWRYHYARQGRPLGIADCLIAATAVTQGAILVTGNLRDFPMPELSILPLPRPGARQP